MADTISIAALRRMLAAGTPPLEHDEDCATVCIRCGQVSRPSNLCGDTALTTPCLTDPCNCHVAVYDALPALLDIAVIVAGRRRIEADDFLILPRDGGTTR